MGRRPATLKLSYVQAFTDKTGRRRHYFRRAGKRVPLPGLPGSREFMDAYAAALGDEPTVPVKRAAVTAGSVADLVQRYYASPNFLRLSIGSKRDYARILDQFAAEHGHRRIDQLTRQAVDALVGKMADRPGAGIKLLKRIRTLVHYGLEIGWIDRDPTAGATSYRSREIHTWTEEEIAAFETRWPTGTKQRLAFALLLYTGQRGSDVHRMTWTDVAGDAIRVAQQKTGERLVIPLHPALQVELACSSRATVPILSTATGKPFSVKGFGNIMSDAITAAGLPSRCKAHGLRKAAARRLAEAGATSKQIAAVTGHKTLSEIERYTRAAEQAQLARQAIERQTGARERKAISIVKPDPKV